MILMSAAFLTIAVISRYIVLSHGRSLVAEAEDPLDSTPPPWLFLPVKQCPIELARSVFTEDDLYALSNDQVDAFTAIEVDGRCPPLSRACGSFAEWLAEESALRAVAVRNTIAHAWDQYAIHAMGADEIDVVHGEPAAEWGGTFAVQLIDSLDTLYLAGFHQQFDDAIEWLVDNVHYDHHINVNVFETTIRQLGGLLSAYHLSGLPRQDDRWGAQHEPFYDREDLLDSAVSLGERLMRAFPLPLHLQPDRNVTAATVAGDVEGGVCVGWRCESMMAWEFEELLASDVNLRTGETQNLAHFASLAEVGTLQLELKMLSELTGDCRFSQAADATLDLIERKLQISDQGLAPILLVPYTLSPPRANMDPRCHPFLPPEYMVYFNMKLVQDQEGGEGEATVSDPVVYPPRCPVFSLGARGDSFYEYLVKEWISTGRSDPVLEKMIAGFLQQLPILLVKTTYTPPPLPYNITSTPPDSPLVQGLAEGSLHFPAKEMVYVREVIGDQGTIEGSFRAYLAVKRWKEEMGFVDRDAGASQHGEEEGESGEDAEAAALVRQFHAIMPKSPIGDPKMDHLVCFLPGLIMLLVASGFFEHRRKKPTPTFTKDQYVWVAEEVAKTCVHSYFRTVTGLAPEIVRFDAKGMVDDLGAMHSLLRPETIESLFYLNRFSAWTPRPRPKVTQPADQAGSDESPQRRAMSVERERELREAIKGLRYRNFGWRIYRAIETVAKVPYGYASVENVQRWPPTLLGRCHTFVSAETFKYLYLLYAEPPLSRHRPRHPHRADDTTVPLDLDSIVFNTEAHPLPILRKGGRCGRVARAKHSERKRRRQKKRQEEMRAVDATARNCTPASGVCVGRLATAMSLSEIPSAAAGPSSHPRCARMTLSSVFAPVCQAHERMWL
ncbi:unnamed protein product [Vitrella brassicaformis CCMP3155]|uniref:alpha-1,2-Mannosidase n=2 Tax=Vitrella brassicaformis TaxID=1169539 RepID=A0A0G4GJF8_VITBC|nr:unnamed protein product [Vitrella brassicaformis CCMP3155]|eukprot:CEM30059.1 unnamed protein product [Vitrella brassicaformis CCMP3155]